MQLNKSFLKKPRIETFCTVTDGNHGRAVAWSAKFFHKKAIIFVPMDTSFRRIEAIRIDNKYSKQAIREFYFPNPFNMHGRRNG